MLAKIINFPMPQNALMLKACGNPNGCVRRVSYLATVEGTPVEVCLCPAWTASMDGDKILYACGLEQLQQQIPDRAKI